MEDAKLLCDHGLSYWTTLSQIAVREAFNCSPDFGDVLFVSVGDEGAQKEIAVDSLGSLVQKIIVFLYIPLLRSARKNREFDLKMKLLSISEMFRFPMSRAVDTHRAFSYSFVVACNVTGTKYAKSFCLVYLTDDENIEIEILDGKHGKQDIVVVTIADKSTAVSIKAWHTEQSLNV